MSRCRDCRVHRNCPGKTSKFQIDSVLSKIYSTHSYRTLVDVAARVGFAEGLWLVQKSSTVDINEHDAESGERSDNAYTNDGNNAGVHGDATVVFVGVEKSF